MTLEKASWLAQAVQTAAKHEHALVLVPSVNTTLLQARHDLCICQVCLFSLPFAHQAVYLSEMIPYIILTGCQCAVAERKSITSLLLVYLVCSSMLPCSVHEFCAVASCHLCCEGHSCCSALGPTASQLLQICISLLHAGHTQSTASIKVQGLAAYRDGCDAACLPSECL